METELRRGPASQINPDAGSHVVSLDPVEREAAAAATVRSWQEFPYYAQRYGIRGWKFSLSDSGWLQTLPDLAEHDARGQVRWLASVLAARGMPSYLLERHLDLLHVELSNRLPAQGARYRRLLVCRDELGHARRRALDEDAMLALAAAFDTGARDVPGRIANFGVVLAAAVADERVGHARAVEAVIEWATDGGRFSPRWCEAVLATLADVRGAPGGRPD